MAFHSKGGSTSRSPRTNRRDKESILGLSGWLFADLLLAIAVIFLVVDQDSQADAGPVATTTTTTTTTTVPSVKTGLIADRSKQLKIVIPGGGSTGQTVQDFKDLLTRASFRFDDQDQTPTSADLLKEENYKIGFVIWFARDSRVSGSTYKKYFGTLVKWFFEEQLIDEGQFDKDTPQNFPSLDKYEDEGAGRDVILRVFLFKTMQ